MLGRIPAYSAMALISLGGGKSSPPEAVRNQGRAPFLAWNYDALLLALDVMPPDLIGRACTRRSGGRFVMIRAEIAGLRNL
jgi:hypothetical protein